MSSDPESASAARRKILLIVEDNTLKLKLINDVLMAHGYETLVSRDLPEALAPLAGTAPI